MGFGFGYSRHVYVLPFSEVSDQNFVDIPGGNSSCKSVAKRLKTAESDCSSKDHVIYLNPEAYFLL